MYEKEYSYEFLCGALFWWWWELDFILHRDRQNNNKKR